MTHAAFAILAATIIRRVLLAGLAVIALTSCGGGGGGDDEAPPPSLLTITIPSENPAHTTDSVADLAGYAFNSQRFITCSFFGKKTDEIDTGVIDSISNAAGGTGSGVSQTVQCCGFSIPGWLCDTFNSVGNHSWNASVPLVLGENVITVTARDTSGNIGRDTVTIIRSP